MLPKAVRAAMLDGSVYREISETPEDMLRAMAVVVSVAIAFGFGLGFRSDLVESFNNSQVYAILVPASTILLGWVLWSFVAYIIGSRLLGGSASNRLLLRGIGIAHGPGIFMALSAFFNDSANESVIGNAILTLSLFWMLLAAIVAVRQIQGEGWVRAIIPTTIGWFLAEFILQGVILPL